jgi:hypothetical protein
VLDANFSSILRSRSRVHMLCNSSPGSNEPTHRRRGGRPVRRFAQARGQQHRLGQLVLADLRARCRRFLMAAGLRASTAYDLITWRFMTTTCAKESRHHRAPAAVPRGTAAELLVVHGPSIVLNRRFRSAFLEIGHRVLVRVSFCYHSHLPSAPSRRPRDRRLRAGF